MSKNVLVIPATFMVGSSFPANLPLVDGSMKPIGDCSKEEVRQAVEEVTALADGSRSRLRKAYEEYVQDLEVLAQLSAYLDRYDEWDAVREGQGVSEIIWSVEHGTDD